jgi:SAM-dependent methyltransferase
MSQPSWDDRYNTTDFVYGTEPNVWLSQQQELLPHTGRALAVADGEGRNGVWLAKRGLDVLAVDGSAVGLAKARRLAEERQCAQRYSCVQADLLSWEPESSAFDLVVQCFLHLPKAPRMAVHTALVKALAPGGLLVLECFTPRQLAFGTGGPKDAAMLYEPEDLRRDFAGLDILHLAECQVELSEGPLHRGTSAVVRMVARAPK